MEEDACACLKFSDCDRHEDAVRHNAVCIVGAPKSGAGAQAPAALSAPPTFHVCCSDTIGGVRSNFYSLDLAFAITGKAAASPASFRGIAVGWLDLYCSCFRWDHRCLTRLWHEGLEVT